MEGLSQLSGLIPQTLNSDLNSIKRRTEQIESNTERLMEVIIRMDAELKQLRKDFDTLKNSQEKNASVQKSVSELIRVRQEIDQKYGQYSEIRETMIGILQATDAAIVRKSTISRVSEELMLSAPRYWLAPCLIAVSAWISNDHDLATRAIQEALKRDEEKTALAMALICRRNGRIRTAHEWLSVYFSKQSIDGFTDESFTYVDAYVNGIFGPDEAHLCQGYLEKWLMESKKRIHDIETVQVARWKEYCRKYFRHVDGEFPTLQTSVTDYPAIDEQIGRIRSVDEIKGKFQLISDAFVDREEMIQSIDAELVRLVGTYDESEMEIRKEEEFLILFRNYDGDETKARAEMERRLNRRKQKKINLIDQMTKQLTGGEGTSPSKRKTAMAFLTPYIEEGFHQYITEKRDQFPEQVEIKIDSWKGTATGPEDLERLCGEYQDSLRDPRAMEIQHAREGRHTKRFIFGILCCIAAVAAYLSGSMQLAIGAAVVAVLFFISGANAKKNANTLVEQIKERYDRRLQEGEAHIRKVLDEWQRAKTIVHEFDNKVADLRLTA